MIAELKRAVAGWAWSPTGNQRGFSLTEGLIAIALVGTAVVPLVHMQSMGFSSGVRTKHVGAASALAVELVDRARSLSYDDARLAATESYTAPPASVSPANPLGPDGRTRLGCGHGDCGYTRTWKITEDSPLPYTKTISVLISWKERGVIRTFGLDVIKAVGS